MIHSKLKTASLWLLLFLLVASGLLFAVKRQPSLEIPIRVTCGADSLGKPGSPDYWCSDKPFATAGEYRVFNERIITKGVENAGPNKLYQSVRQNDPSWHFRGVPDGLYLVRLHLADTKDNSKRKMNFWFQGEKLIANFSIIKAAGGPCRAYVREVVVPVTGGHGVKIRASRGAGDDAFVAGIEILPAPKNARPSPALDNDNKRPSDLSSRIRNFTGSATRIVWTRMTDFHDIFGERRDSQLFGFDTEDGRDERCILDKADSYARPLLTPDGQRIIFSNVATHTCYIVNFDGSGLREFAKGFAAAIWSHPETHEPWVCVRETEGKGPTEIITRRKLDNPEEAVRIWTTADNGTSVMSHFSLMSDGVHAVDCNPWPNIGTIDLERGRFRSVANGCWPHVCPDETERFFTFRGNHRSILMFDNLKAEGRRLNLDTVPGAPAPTVYHPRWTNDPQFITITSPLGHPRSTLYLGRFDSRFSNIDSWRRITYSDKPEAFGNAWIAGSSAATNATRHIPWPKEQSEEPAARQRQGLVFLWENQRADNAITDEHGRTLRLCGTTLHGHARPSPTLGADIRDGSLIADEESSRLIAVTAAKSNALTLTFVTQIDNASRDGVVACYGRPGQPSALLVEQKAAQLQATILSGGDSPRITLGNITPGQPQHWSLIVDARGLLAIQNGQMSAHTETGISLASWQPGTLRFGSDADGGLPWNGWLEHIEVYGRALDGPELTALHAAATSDWPKRQPISRIVIEAELIEASKTPEPDNIRPYQRSLAENLYKVRKVISGELKEDRIVALQWCILDGRKIEANRTPGTIVTLSLEEEEAHPELGGENRSSDLLEPGVLVLYDTGS